MILLIIGGVIGIALGVAITHYAVTLKKDVAEVHSHLHRLHVAIIEMKHEVLSK